MKRIARTGEATVEPSPQAARQPVARLVLRVVFGNGAIGPGKARLLELVAETGSISAAARTMRMSYRRAWLLVDAINATFHTPAVQTREGGAGGGGATLTPFGADLVRRYRAMEAASHHAAAADLAVLDAAASPAGKQPG